MHPEPIGGIATDGCFKGYVNIAHDCFDRTGLAIFVKWDFVADFKTPSSEGGAVADDGIER